MKKSIFFGLVIASLMSCYAEDITRYQNVYVIKNSNVKQPAISEIKNLHSLGNYVIVDGEGKYIQQQSQTVYTSEVILPLQAEGCTDTCKNALPLADGSLDTTFDFPLNSSGVQKGSIAIKYAKPLLTDSITFKTTSDSYMPTAFTLTIDGKRILNTIDGGSARFPRMTAQNIEIQFEYTQPIRFTEVGVGFNKDEKALTSVRFVYQPGQTYTLYTDSPLGREFIPSPVVNLYAKQAEIEASLDESHKNPLYKERDTDSDNVIDSIDNCPRQANSDQMDGNGNGVGDTCDDYDYDSVPTFNDNCPTVANPDQMDSDKDSIGDMCDKEESRVTEKYPWLPWTVFAGVFLIIGVMVYEVMKMKREKSV